MAAMDFPSGHINDLASSSASLHDSLHDGFYSPSPFDTSTFQLNPLSARPPHTDADLPHPPAISSSHFSLRNTSFHDGSHESTTSAASESSEATASGAAAPPKPADVIQVHDPNGEGDAASEFDEEDERVKTAEKNIAPYQVWRDILATCDGRDKAFKAIQYAVRVYLLVHVRILFRNSASLWQRALAQRLESVRTGFSFTRKMLILFNWLSPLHTILSQKAVPYTSLDSSILDGTSKVPLPNPSSPRSLTEHFLSHPFLQALLAAPPPVLLDLVSGLAEDVTTLSRLGLAGPRLGKRAARFADWCWFLSTLAGLVQNGLEVSIVDGLGRDRANRLYEQSVAAGTASRSSTSKADEKELARLHRRSHWLHLIRTKLVMDLVFVSFDVFGLKSGKETIQSLAGMGGALISCAKLYDRYRNALVAKAI